MARPFYYPVRTTLLDGTVLEYRHKSLADARKDLDACQNIEGAVEVHLEKVFPDEQRYEGPEKGHSPPEVRQTVDKRSKVEAGWIADV